MLALLLLLSAWPSLVAAQLAWKTNDWIVACLTVSDGTCETTEGAGATDYYEISLRDASQWLSDLGFGGPAIEYQADTNTYIAYISDANNENSKGERTSIGVYYPGAEQLYITSDRYFAIGKGDTEKERKNALASDLAYVGTIVHELFHAVQYGYYRDGSSVRGWITEGMADAVMLAWLRRDMPFEDMRGGARAFDFPLHKPQKNADAYNSEIFWRGVGKILRSRNDIAYLPTILEQNLGVNWGLSGVDDGLRKFDPDGLYNLYPEFIARYANHRLHYAGLQKLGMQYDESTVERSVRGTVREVAADGIEISVNVPVGEMARLKIELAHQHDDLHLIVDDKRLDTRTGNGRNVFQTTVDGKGDAQTFLVRVANVARRAIDSGDRLYRLDVSLAPTTSQSTCSFTAEIDIVPTGPYTYFMADGNKLPIQRIESIVGIATVDDLRHQLLLHYDDKQGHAGSGFFAIDLSQLAIGGDEEALSTRGRFSHTSPKDGPYRVTLGIDENADPGDVEGWDAMTWDEHLENSVGYPNRLAMRRLRGDFHATRTDAPDCCVGYAQSISGTFDAGNGPYHCEGGLEVMENAQKAAMDMFNNLPERRPDPGKLDDLFN